MVSASQSSEARFSAAMAATYEKRLSLLPPGPEKENFQKYIDVITPTLKALGDALIKKEELDKQLISAKQEEERAALAKQEAALAKQEAARVKQEAEVGILAARQAKQEARDKLKEIAEKKENLDKVTEKIGKEKQRIITERFYEIFHGKKPAAEKVDTIFTTYLADKSLRIEKNTAGKNYAKLDKMTSVIHYLEKEKDPTITKLDFRDLKREVYDIPTLVDYLKTSSTIRAIAFNKKSIPEEYNLYLKDKVILNAKKELVKIHLL